ncbi:MAG: polysaccharide-degrading enzyme, partial [Pedosphaera parvula]|nr:polysaccharide-degrading enzyme [Pedosphaera parvula]
MKSLWLLLVLALAAVDRVDAAQYEVGPGKPLPDPIDVPWESLQAGDTVLIHWRAEPYRSKWVICFRGTARQPIIVRGVPGPNGQLPVIDGRDARTRKELSYWHEQRSVIKIGGANRPKDLFPAWIVIENLEVRGGRPPFSYRGSKG